MKIIKTSIQNNKEFIIPLTSLIISFATILIMIQANKIMNTTNQIMERQIEISMAENLPLIRFDVTYDVNQSGFAIGENIVSYNDGGKITDFHTSEITYIEIQIHDYSKESDEFVLTLPIEDYYDSLIPTSGLQHKIFTYDNLLSSEGNNKKKFELIQEFMQEAKPYMENKTKETGNAFVIGVPEFKSYIFLEYTDIFSNKNSEYYEVNIFGTKKLLYSTGEKLFKNNSRIKLEQLSASLLLELIEERINN